MAYCVREKKSCVYWAERYFKDCLCNLKDEVSFGFGLVSLVCWGVAEIPQILTNFYSKSGHGVSLMFLLTWVVGDVFNLVGCLLEPATLPTQFYTAVLYTGSTIVLVLQTIYYDYIRRWWKYRGIKVDIEVEDDKKPLNPKSLDSSMPIPASPLKVSRRSDMYYMSARSLASSGTPPLSSSFLGLPRSGPSAFAVQDDSSDDDESLSTCFKPSSQPIRIPRSVGYGTFLAASVNLPRQSKALMEGYVRLSGRRLLQDGGSQSNAYGLWLGWLMAAIYMGGRIPQICLNIKRGSVEGLNPLMFIFALIANVAYVGSILVRTTEWDKTKANMPWLLDAVVCVALDLFIIIQFIYYRFRQRKTINRQGDYSECKLDLKA